MSATVPVVRFTIAGVAVGDGPDTAAGAFAAGTGEGRSWTVVYDGHCKVCGRLARTLGVLDRKRVFEILPSQAPGLHARFPWIPARAYTESLQLVGPGGRTEQGAAAIERIIRLLPPGPLVSWVFAIPFVRPAADRFYRWFARNRYKLGCGDHCTVRAELLDFEGGGGSGAS